MARHHALALLLVVVTAAVFAEVRCMEFVDWDDHANVCKNRYLNPVNLENTVHFWKKSYFGFYIPVTRTVWAALAYVAQKPPDEMGFTVRASYFHVANLVVHLLNVLLVFAIVRLLIRSDWPAAAGAALFALHPVQVEPVAWVTGMKDLLGGLLGLAALWQYLLYAVQTRDQPEARWRRAHYVLAMVAFALAVLSKQTVVVVPLMAWALDRWVLGRPLRDCTWALAGWAPLAVGAAVIAGLTGVPVPEPPPLWARLFVAGDAAAFYLSKLALPVPLGCNYGRYPELVLTKWWGYVTWLAPMALAVVLWLVRRRAPVLVAAGAVFLAGVLPVLGLVPFENQDVCDRFMYLAMLGPALALAWLALEHGSKLLAAGCVIGLGVLGFLSGLQALTWYNTSQLFSHALEVNPHSWLAHKALGYDLAGRGQVNQAYAHYMHSLRLKPDFADTHENLGVLLLGMGQPERAIKHLREALRLDPPQPLTHYNLAVALEVIGKPDQAIEHYRQAARLDPESWTPHNNLAALLHHQGRDAEAEAHYLEAIRIRPQYADAHYNLGLLYADTGRLQQARAAFAEARRLAPELEPPPDLEKRATSAP